MNKKGKTNSKTRKPTASKTQKPPTFKQLYKLQNECHATAGDLYNALHDAMPENLRNAFFLFASLQNVSLMSIHDRERTNFFRDVKKWGKQALRKLQRKAA